MLELNFRRALLVMLLFSLIIVSACTNSEEKKAAQIIQARLLAEQGSSVKSLEILEDLAKEYPNDGEILSMIGKLYSNIGDLKTAAFFLEQSYLLDEQNVERLYNAYNSLEAAQLPAAKLLEKLSTLGPELMIPQLWVRLGEFRKAENKVQPALEAYLKGVDASKEKPQTETATAIGQLFVKIGNLNQAKNWFLMAASEDDANALTALFGILKINLRQKDWSSASETISLLDEQFPGAVDASQWKDAKKELLIWRDAQDAMKAKLARAESNITAGKEQIIADLNNVETFAEMPAVDITDGETEEALPAVEKDLNDVEDIPIGEDLLVKPEVNDSLNSTDKQVEMSGNTSDSESITLLDSISRAEEKEDGRSKTIEELISNAKRAEIERNFKSAIADYWAAMGIDNNRADIWNNLSRAYLIDGQIANADIAALEAVRLEPLTITYTLDYLRVAQKSKTPYEFLAQLETAYDRFPTNAEIILSLARAHEKISKNNIVARDLYLRFIDIAPGHPLVGEAETAVARL